MYQNQSLINSSIWNSRINYIVIFEKNENIVENQIHDFKLFSDISEVF